MIIVIIIIIIIIIIQASALTQSVTGLLGPITPSIYWSCKLFTGATNFSLT